MLFQDLNIAMSIKSKENGTSEGIKPEMTKMLMKGIEITINSIWNEGNRTAEKRKMFPEILQLNVTINR